MMFITRIDKTLRIWFAAVTNAGAYRPGLTQASFTANIVNPMDTTQVTVLVSESAQRPGTYYFDVPASFLTTNGAGDYLASVKIDSVSGSAGMPTIRGVKSEVVRVSHEDLDSISGSIWNTPAGAFNATGSMGFLQNSIATIGMNTSPASIASAVWDAVAASANASGTFGWIQNQLYASSSQEATVSSIVSGVWNSNPDGFSSVGTFGALVNDVLRGVEFHLSSTFVASSSIASIADSRTWVSTSLTNEQGQFDGMLLMLRSPLSGVQTRVIDSFRTGTFDVDPGFTFGTASDNVFVISTQFTPGRGYIG